MKLAVTPQRMRAMEDKAFKAGVPPLLLMEQAARAVADKTAALLGNQRGKKVLVVCGPGNNGGDGLAAARMLLERGFDTDVWLAGEPKTEECRANLKYFLAIAGERVTRIDRELPFDGVTCWPPAYDALIDAVFGTGFRGAPKGIYAELIALMNECAPSIVLAIDIPSGMDGESGAVSLKKKTYAFEGQPAEAFDCVRATHTVALGCAKTGLYLSNHKDYAGIITVAPLDLPPDCQPLLLSEGLCAPVMEEKDLAGFLPLRAPDTHKGISGCVLLYAGSLGMAGAAAMAAKAALRAGAGLVTVACPRDQIPIIQTLVPGALCADISDNAHGLPAHDVLAAGCGIGRTSEARERLMELLRNEKAPVVLDADALYLLAEQPFDVPENAVLTPHVGEAARLLKRRTEDVAGDMIGASKALYERFGASVVLKSATTVIWNGKTLALNVRGGPALAKGGSGDALCGILAALLADRAAALSMFDAARTACLWLGLAGERAGEKYGERSALTTEVIDELGPALQKARA